MALHAYTLGVLAKARAPARPDPRAAMFGLHDLLVPPAALAELCGKDLGLPFRPDSAEILAWHKAQDVTPGVVDTHAFFEAIGWKLDAFDVVNARGRELIHDLNEPFPAEYHRAYDLVYDNVLGQVFNAGQCMRSAMDLVAVGGCLLSVSSANAPNHGFYSVSPTLYADALAQNGFDVLHRAVVVDILRNPKEFPFAPATGCVLPHKAVNVVLAARYADVPFAYPVQAKFARNPTSKRPAC